MVKFVCHKATRLASGEYLYRGYKVKRYRGRVWCILDFQGRDKFFCDNLRHAKELVDYFLDGWGGQYGDTATHLS